MSHSTSWKPLHDQLHRTLRLRQLLPPDQRLLVAVSGGQDSLCLIKVLLDLQPKWQWNLAIAHCDHGWRADSSANADYIEQLAQSWQVPFYRETATQIPQTEAAARQWRYQALGKIARIHNYPYVVTGHTASDRAETLLYNLVRGSGSDGLQALTWKRPLWEAAADTQRDQTPIVLVRPLLEIMRSQTAQFCQEEQLKIWEDHTNQDLHYARNRIRAELLPYLQTHFNPQTEQALAQTAELLQAEVEYLDQQAQQLYQRALPDDQMKPSSPYQAAVNRVVLRHAPLALQRRVMRKVLQQILPKAPNFEGVEKLTALITAPNRSQTDPFPGGAIAKVDREWILLS